MVENQVRKHGRESGKIFRMNKEYSKIPARRKGTDKSQGLGV